MDESFVLEMDLDQVDEDRCKLRFRFFRPGDAAESSLGLAAPVMVSIHAEALREVAGDPQEYGTRLGSMVFADPGARLAFAQARAAAGSAPLRLRLAVDPAAQSLHNLRWEALVDLDRRGGLFSDEHVLFSRFLPSSSWQTFEAPQAARLRALVMIANPQLSSLAAIDTAGYLAQARAGLVNMQVTTLVGKGQATLETLVDRLRDGCDVLYLVAHGAQTAQRALVFLENPDGSADGVEVERLVERLRMLGKPPLLAVLISCESAGDPKLGGPLLAFGPRLVMDAGIPAVVAMHGKISFDTMELFLPVFFKELARDGKIDRAMAVARARVLGQPDWWMPVLFSRLRDNQLLQPPEIARVLALQRYEPETVYIAPGPFWMGRDGGDDVPEAEKPCHSVNLPGYRIGKTPVTNAQYAEFVRKTRHLVSPESRWEGQSPPAARLNEPMVGVTWEDAMKYCAWLSAATGRKYTLPNEAQWEKAARGIQGDLYPWGNEWPPADLPELSPFGCVRMVGGIREWTLSLWGTSRAVLDYPYPWVGDERNNPAAGMSVLRVFRGGPASAAGQVTCTTRGGFQPDKNGPAGNRHGFRVVLLSQEGGEEW